ncbi:conserved hypothetical protein [Vibrio owensii]|uniref:Uncharacterized protein n=1 Tax=Vibrio owensii TaxID=696485 RepID=A0AAU9Q068_9VIBR|nr:hypothetical protein VCHENC03_0666 [Vibrio sp. HENC-03]CAD7810471.1 hypothetical protein ACOMICROBIO_NCLOACGD_02218 [Vibrio sp. B1ASS3]CAH1520701.1 conserved hypothetical protein [Vibrio owensii]CAE6912319.1 hypothetical protein ACOMICROBIO_NCLOACGD_02218 [Vibrio sp. B1ASS3]CAH1534899.1 conserved hypothetical protein [Vibrio owensii]
MPDPDTEIKQHLPLGSIGEIYRIKTKHALSLKPRKVTFGDDS